MAEKMRYDALFAGEVLVTAAVPVTKGTYARGDLLECDVTSKVTCAAAGTEATAVNSVAASFHKAAATAKPGNIYMIAAEAKTLEAAGTIDAYGAGYYDIANVRIVGDETTNKLVLLSQGIVLKNCQSGE